MELLRRFVSVEVRPEGFIPGSIDLLVEQIRKKRGSAGKRFIPVSLKILFTTNLVIHDTVKKGDKTEGERKRRPRLKCLKRAAD